MSAIRLATGIFTDIVLAIVLFFFLVRVDLFIVSGATDIVG
jgi:hypothetical protein